MKICYTLDRESYKQGIELDYRLRKQTLACLESGVLMAAVLLILFALIRDTSNGLYWVFLGIGLWAFLYTLLLQKQSIIRRLMREYTPNGFRYELTVSEGKITLDYIIRGDEKPVDGEPRCLPYPEFSMGFEYLLGKRYVRAYEYEDFIGLYNGYTNIIPKSKLTHEELTSLTRILKQTMGKRYKIM